MSLIYRRRANQPSITHVISDYLGELKPFAKRIGKWYFFIPLVIMKSIEWSIYRWYKTPIRRFYGVKGNELIYMITKRCNERCPKCGIWETPEPDNEHIDVSVFINSLKTLNENLYQVTITGGEPLLFAEDVLKIAEESRKHDIRLLTFTNGVLITEDFLKQYAELNHKLVISIDTLNENKWTSFRGKATFDKVMENIKLSKKYLGGNLQIQSVIASESEAEIASIQSFCKELGVLHTTQTYLDFGGVWNNPTDTPKLESSSVACAARKNIIVYPNGDVVKCFDHRRIPLAKEPLGNIEKEDIVQILCKKRSTEVSKIMKTCNFPCKEMACNVPEIIYN
ncbi:radical SAM/SPASM domain-containing protein [Carboxylicivirga marina]|uniref:radical SAM/SPASM domain-containing protein n=1 Tax=Carboxylicivirga marina TaxID=2800988 RepID=UPI002596CC3C|nr:radical SAM protein [uncultured Carboxylicivirga sp.]